jgi:hypothetical protein
MPTMADSPLGESGDVLTAHSAEAADNVDEQLRKLRSTTASHDAALPSAMREAAILGALSARQTTADERLAVRATLDRLDNLNNALGDVSRQIATSVTDFTRATQDSTESLARWTRVMAWATIAIAVFAIAQVVVAIMGLFTTH